MIENIGPSMEMERFLKYHLQSLQLSDTKKHAETETAHPGIRVNKVTMSD